MKIWNLTLHPASPEQREAGVIDLPEPALSAARALLNFEELPSPGLLAHRATVIAAVVRNAAKEGDWVMIGGAPFFMAPLEKALLDDGLWPVYAFSRREVLSETQQDGTVIKKNIFRHLGFIEVEG